VFEIDSIRSLRRQPVGKRSVALVPPVINLIHQWTSRRGGSEGSRYFVQQATGFRHFVAATRSGHMIGLRHPTGRRIIERWTRCIISLWDAAPPAGRLCLSHPCGDDGGPPPRSARAIGSPPQPGGPVAGRTRGGFAAAAMIHRSAGRRRFEVSAKKGYLDGRDMAEIFAWRGHPTFSGVTGSPTMWVRAQAGTGRTCCSGRHTTRMAASLIVTGADGAAWQRAGGPRCG